MSSTPWKGDVTMIIVSPNFSIKKLILVQKTITILIGVISLPLFSTWTLRVDEIDMEVN